MHSCREDLHTQTSKWLLGCFNDLAEACNQLPWLKQPFPHFDTWMSVYGNELGYEFLLGASLFGCQANKINMWKKTVVLKYN